MRKLTLTLATGVAAAGIVLAAGTSASAAPGRVPSCTTPKCSVIKLTVPRQHCKLVKCLVVKLPPCHHYSTLVHVGRPA